MTPSFWLLAAILFHIGIYASTAGHKPAFEHANYYDSMPLASNYCLFILLHGHSILISFDAVATSGEVCFIGNSLSCRQESFIATSAYWILELSRSLEFSNVYMTYKFVTNSVSIITATEYRDHHTHIASIQKINKSLWVIVVSTGDNHLKKSLKFFF